MPVAVIVDWYGPYNSLDGFTCAMKKWPENERTLYMALGPYNRIHYIGMTESPHYRPYQHQQLQEPENKTFYTGNIVTRGISGRRGQTHAPDLTIAEHILIWKMQPKLNIALINNPPDDCVSVFSRFFKIDAHDVSHNPLPKFSSLIAFNSWTNEIATT